MSFGTAMQRTMPTSTSYSSVPCIRQVTQRGFPCPTPRQGAGSSVQCTAYRQQNCGPRYGPQRGFGPMSFGDGAFAAAQVADLMNQMFAKSVNQKPNADCGAYWPVDIEEQEAKYLVIADIPGLEKADLKISINQTEQTLKIAGERQRAKTADQSDEQSGAQKFRRQYERGMGKFQRTISNLPKDADLSSVSARVDKGVLTISIQKKDLARDEQDIRIDVD